MSHLVISTNQKGLRDDSNIAGIELCGLTKHYDTTVATHDVNLHVDPGEFVTFLGPSGSGKTTTLMMIAGFVIPSAGDIRIANKSIVTLPPHKRNIGMVFQNYALFPHLDVARNVAFPLEMRHVPKSEIAKRVEGALKLVKLQNYANRRPRELSGGQQQRVALARALVFHPPILLLDEPLGALDAQLREEMKYELKQLHLKIGITILFVTHDQQEALTLSDRVAVFNHGTIVQIGAPTDLYRYPANRFVASFIGKSNLLEGKVVRRDPQSICIRLGETLEMRASYREGFREPNNSAVYLLRTESVRIGNAAVGVENQYEGTVTAVFYAGSATEYVIRIGEEWLISARIPATETDMRLAVGDQVRVGWKPSDALLVEADGADSSAVGTSEAHSGQQI
ncbi:MAG: ABC transporter ATP-binding protein [Proteobacteria bacterium]|nr:ABC transporter ATP-binding protein [Pseudomonadota bacterium]